MASSQLVGGLSEQSSRLEAAAAVEDRWLRPSWAGEWEPGEGLGPHKAERTFCRCQNGSRGVGVGEDLQVTQKVGSRTGVLPRSLLLAPETQV